MVIDVLWFASLKQQSGCSSERVELAPGSDVRALWEKMLERHPGLAGLGFRPLVACDRSYADWERRLDGVREVAFLPPVSGG